MHLLPFTSAAISCLAILAVPQKASACWPVIDREPRAPTESPIALRIEALETASFPQAPTVRVLAVLKGPYKAGQVIRVKLSGNMCDPHGRKIIKGSHGTISASLPSGREPIAFSGYWEARVSDWRTRQRARAIPPNRPAMPRVAPQNWISANDYPLRALREKQEGMVHYRLHFGVNGRVSRCDIIRSSRHAELDEATCRYARYRALFIPATNANAEPVPGALTYTYRWKVP